MAGPSTLPKTTHALKHDQRVRLMRSTRKVEALLGETPLLVDPSSPRNSTFPQPNPRRPVYIYPAKPRSSSLGVYNPSDSPHASTSRLPPRPVLAVAIPVYEDIESPLGSAVSLSFPTYPPSPADDQRRQRTRKMARIVRTLGENVPTELVFPAQAQRTRRSSVAARRRSSSKLLRNPSYASTREHETLVEEDAERAEPAVARRRSSKLLRNASSRMSTRRHETLVEEDAEREGPAVAESDTDSVSMYSTLSGGDWLPVVAESVPSAAEPPVGYDRGTHRKEKGWSGEWVATGAKGMQSMDDVARRLRDLRLR
ncbi:hypothetical protein B0H11DRAFT_1959774 [Mycena galericulata]|nr:hypothetical protein B0H11DRAFT_1959774 [Mycena galericulata]